VDAVRPDESRWYSIALRRGQRLAATAVVVSRCPVDHAVADVIGTALEIEVFGPSGGLPEQHAGVANLFPGDESVEGTGLLTEPVGPKPRRVQSFARPGRYTLRFALSDNGLHRLRERFGDGPLPLQIETRRIGARVAEPSGRRVARAPVAARGSDRDALAVVAGGAIVVGLLAGLVLVALRRRGQA
jgi:hypothetical protein